MAQLNDLLPDLAARISSVPEFVARPMLRQAVQQFCQHSYMWQVEQSITLAGDERYPLEIPEGTLVAGIVAGALDGKMLRQGYDFELSGDETAVVIMNPQLSGSTLKLAIAVKPARKSDTFDDKLLEHYGNEIAAGAAAELGTNEKEAWALSKQQIVDYRNMFEGAFQEARKRALNHASRLYEAPTRHQFF